VCSNIATSWKIFYFAVQWRPMSHQSLSPLDQNIGGYEESHCRQIEIDLRKSTMSWFTYDKSSQETEYNHDIRLIRCSTRSSPSTVHWCTSVVPLGRCVYLFQLFNNTQRLIFTSFIVTPAFVSRWYTFKLQDNQLVIETSIYLAEKLTTKSHFGAMQTCCQTKGNVTS
jgi:hypothetical protein